MVKETNSKRVRSARVRRKYAQARRDILAIASRRLEESGVEAITLASIASELGMTKQAIYHYFASKEVLVQSLIAALLDEEVEYLIRTVEQTGAGEKPLGTLIQAFHSHYANRLNAFRLVYCQSQLLTGPGAKLDEHTLREDINPRTRHLFDVLEGRMSPAGANQQERERQRQLAFSAWLSALGLMTMHGIADATNDPLIHSDERLLLTLKRVFDQAAATP